MDITVEKLVIIDDDNIHNFIAKRLLDKLDVVNNIRIIKSASEAIRFIVDACVKKTEGICPEIILLDFHFCNFTATEILEEVKKQGVRLDGHIIIFVISASELKEEEKQRLLEYEVKGFLTKPIKEEHIQKALEIYCQEKFK